MKRKIKVWPRQGRIVLSLPLDLLYRQLSAAPSIRTAGSSWSMLRLGPTDVKPDAGLDGTVRALDRLQGCEVDVPCSLSVRSHSERTEVDGKKPTIPTPTREEQDAE